MPTKQQPKLKIPSPLIQIKPQEAKIEIKIKQNHFSSSHQNLIRYEQKNQEIQYMTKQTEISKQLIKNQMQVPLTQSLLKGQEIFEKYGSLIQNQPTFLRELIYNKYLDYFPSKFQDQFSQIMVIGSGFEFIWWSSLAFFVIKGIKNRNNGISLMQKAKQGVGISFLFLATSIGFYQSFYFPTLKQCFYKNIKLVDTLMDRHIHILKMSGCNIDQTNSNKIEQKQKQEQKRLIVNTQLKKENISKK